MAGTAHRDRVTAEGTATGAAEEPEDDDGGEEREDLPVWRRYWGWSNTKRHQWETCRKQYWFSYVQRFAFPYGSEASAELKFLGRDLDSLGMLTGALVHDAIEDQIKHHRLTREVDPDEARARVRRRVDRMAAAPDKHLVEAVNGHDLDFNAELAERADAACRLLDEFFAEVWPRYADREYLAHEEFEKFTLDGVPVVVVADLVTRADDGTILVTDWKTGSRQAPADDHVQLGTYILWAVQKWAVDPEDVAGELVYLQDGHVDATRRSAGDLEVVRRTIVEQSKAMLDATDFPAEPDADTCPWCPFATVCEEGREHLRADRNPYHA